MIPVIAKEKSALVVKIFRDHGEGVSTGAARQQFGGNLGVHAACAERADARAGREIGVVGHADAD